MDREEKDVVFCIDSSAFIRLHSFYGPELIPEIWEEFENLFNGDKILSHIIVFEELTTSAKKQDNLSKWITSKRQYFRNMTVTQAQYVSDIIRKFPNLIDQNNEKDQADPWLISLVLEEKSQANLFTLEREYFVVSEESMKSPHRIPAVCQHYGIAHLNLIDFFRFNGWKLKMEKI